MKNRPNSKVYQHDAVPTPTYSQLEKWLIGFACINFFRLIYLIGKTILSGGY